ncbi:capsid protein 1 [Galliform chaphamaparvovirus 6]|nr:capsid protein 1 [Galliform chaphamaparvovirus 6]
MPESVNFTNVYCTYITNRPYDYNPDRYDTVDPSLYNETGWHILPTILWRHFVTPREWAEFVIKYERYSVIGYKVTLFNPVPLTSQLTIQGNNILSTFNNTIYGWCYMDDLYETNWWPWLLGENLSKHTPNLANKEGLKFNMDSEAKERFMLPQFRWQRPKQRVPGGRVWSNTSSTQDPGLGVFPLSQNASHSDQNSRGLPTGIFWDPLNRPKNIQELRPGKNAVTMTWEVHDEDKGKWFNLDRLAWWYPYASDSPYNGRLGTYGRPDTAQLPDQTDPDKLTQQYNTSPSYQPVIDYTIPNLADQPIMPCGWYWKEMRESIIKDPTSWAKCPDFWFTGTERELALWPPAQCFTKLVPIFDERHALINITSQISVKVQLDVKAIPRKSAIYAPTWGPFNWKDLYGANMRYSIFHEGLIRYKAGGMRTTWKNKAGPGEMNSTQNYDYGAARETPYLHTDYRVRFNVQDGERVIIEKEQPIAPKRKVLKEPTMAVKSPVFMDITHTQM